MIQLFTNEYMLHPVGLEMSQNACGHNCFYCFATLKDPKRKFNTKSFVNQLTKLKQSNTFLSKKIRDGYPIVFSNNTDPFAKNNENLTREMLPLLVDNKIPLFFQTKTGTNMFEIIKDIPPSTFYISITGINDIISKEVERQAPVVSERIDAISKLQDLGHHVIIGINPLAEEWLPENDFESLLNILKEKNIKSIPMGLLYFRKKEVAKTEKFAKGGVNTMDYLKGNNNKGLMYLKKMVVKHHENNNFVVPNMPFYCEGIEHFLPKHQKKILTIFDFVNHIIKKHGRNEADIYFENYLHFFNNCGFLEDGYKLDNYIFGISPRHWIGKPENQNIMTKEHYYKIVWNLDKVAQSLDMSRLFYKIGIDKNGDVIYRYKGGEIVDKDGLTHKIIK